MKIQVNPDESFNFFDSPWKHFDIFQKKSKSLTKIWGTPGIFFYFLSKEIHLFKNFGLPQEVSALQFGGLSRAISTTAGN